MTRFSQHKALLTAVSVFALGGCQPAAQSAADDVAVGAAEEVDGMEETRPNSPDAQPTASIFGPEAKVPEPEAEANAALKPLDLTIGFPDGGTALDADAVAVLESALKAEIMQGSGPIILRAHSDAGGADEANLTASEKRGLAVAAWLIKRGVSQDRIEVIAFGEQNPALPNALPDGSPNEAGRAANRRVEMVIAARKSSTQSKAKEPPGPDESN